MRFQQLGGKRPKGIMYVIVARMVEVEAVTETVSKMGLDGQAIILPQEDDVVCAISSTAVREALASGKRAIVRQCCGDVSDSIFSLGPNLYMGQQLISNWVQQDSVQAERRKQERVASAAYRWLVQHRAKQHAANARSGEFLFLDAEQIREWRGPLRLSSFTELQQAHPDWFSRKHLDYTDALSGEYAAEYAVVAHRWETQHDRPYMPADLTSSRCLMSIRRSSISG